jgi:hypothetical protein
VFWENLLSPSSGQKSITGIEKKMVWIYRGENGTRAMSETVGLRT